uniref:Uncharacterized protein n=2 Tax=Plectus sambesii TaxID=2011161 RepID=A0A914XG19_9BILA
MGLVGADVQQQYSASVDYERSSSSQPRRPSDSAAIPNSRVTRIDREVLQFIDVQPYHAFLRKDDRPENTIYMSNEDTLLNNGSLVGVNLSRVFRIRDFAMVNAVLGAQWTATGLRTVIPLDNNRSEFVTHALVTEVLPTGIRLFSRCLQKPIDAPVETLPATAIDDEGLPAIRPHQTVVVRVHRAERGENYVAVSVELLPLHSGKGVIYLVREEFSVILYDEPPGNERLPFRYVLAPNDVIKAGGVPINDWYGRRVDFAACVDQPDGSEEFLEGRRYKAVQATIAVAEPRTKHFRSRGVVYSRGPGGDDGRDDAASSLMRSANPSSTPTDMLSLEDKVLNEWRMVHRVPDDEAKGAVDYLFVEPDQPSSTVFVDEASGTRSPQPQQVARPPPIMQHESPFAPYEVITSVNAQRAEESPPVGGVTASPLTADGDNEEQQQQQQQNLTSGDVEWDEEAERRFAEQIRQAEEESLRLTQRLPEATVNAEDDELLQAIAMSVEEERLRLERLREKEERDLEAALNASRLPSDELLEEVLELSRREAGNFHTASSKVDYDHGQLVQLDEATGGEEPKEAIFETMIKRPVTVPTVDIEQLLFADDAPDMAPPIPPLSPKPVDVNTFFQRQLAEFLSSAPTPSLPAVKTKAKEAAPSLPVDKDDLMSETVSDSQPTLRPSIDSIPVDWSLAPKEPKMEQTISNNDEGRIVDGVKLIVDATDGAPPTREVSDNLSALWVDDEERSTVELLDDDDDEDKVGGSDTVDEPPTPRPLLCDNEPRSTPEQRSTVELFDDDDEDVKRDENKDESEGDDGIGGGATPAILPTPHPLICDSETRDTPDESLDEEAKTLTPDDQPPLPDEQLPLPEGVNDELSRISHSQPVYDRVVAIASFLAPHNPKAGVLLEELKKLERK